MTGAIRIGIGGWVYEPWRGTFYPDDLPKARELEFAGSRLTAIEVNGTFYRSQSPQTFAKWRDAVPDGFVLALKGPRFATNRKVLAEAAPSIDRFVSSGIVELGDKLGPINWQLAATKRFDPGDFAAFLHLLPQEVEGHALRHAIEVRHPSFATAEAVELARTRGIALVVAGDSAYPQIADPTGPFVYVRLMGTTDAHPAGYSDAALATWAARVRAWASGQVPDDLDIVGGDAAAEPRDVYLFVISGHKVANPAAAMALIDRLGK